MKLSEPEMCFRKDLLAGKHIAISGGLGALGLAIVKALVQHEARVSIADVIESGEAREQLNATNLDSGRCSYTQADATRSEEISRFISASRNAFGPIHAAVCHAGIVISDSVLEFSEANWDRTMAVNLKSAFLLAQRAATSMIQDKIRGHLIFTTSWVGQVPWPNIAAYNTSKAGMNQLMRSFARELAESGIRANAVAPGIVGAGMAKRQWETEPDYRARAQRAIPLGEMQSLESVANAFLFLCSDAAAYMTGSILLVDGGCSLYPMD